MSWWVSPKRTRSYPYVRVYDTLGFSGKKVTIIPRYKNKITNQRFDTEYVREEIQRLLSYQSDALHWNLEQVDKISHIADMAFNAYRKIARELGVKMHPMESAERRIRELHKGKEKFMELSRKLARKAQERESVTVQPKEHLTGIKGMITIKNYLGGYYYFTCDEVEIHGENIYLIEGKHTVTGNLPSEGDIKDGLIKMILFTNLENVKVDGQEYKPVPVLKLTTNSKFNEKLLSKSKRKLFNLLKEEAKYNGFRVKINDSFIV